MQLGYLGAGPRGDNSWNDYLDKYQGMYSYKLTASSCVSESRGKAYLSFHWNPVDAGGNPVDAGGNPASVELLMVRLPHQVSALYVGGSYSCRVGKITLPPQKTRTTTTTQQQ